MKFFEPPFFTWLLAVGVPPLVGLLVWLPSISLGEHESETNRANKPTKTWQTEVVRPATDFSTQKLVGKVVSHQKAMIHPRRAGQIQDVYVEIGDTVQAGQVVASMLPEGVAGQDQSLIAQAQAEIDQAEATLRTAQAVKEDTVAVSLQSWRQAQVDLDTAQTNLQTAQNTQADKVALAVKDWRQAQVSSDRTEVGNEESERQLLAEKAEAAVIAAQVWENLRLLLFGTDNNRIGSRSVQGTFNNRIQETKVKNLADEIERMSNSDTWLSEENIIEHLDHLSNFLSEVEILYRTAKPYGTLSEGELEQNLKTLQSEQLRLTQIEQSILQLEEKLRTADTGTDQSDINTEQAQQRIAVVESEQAEKIASAENTVTAKTVALEQAEENLDLVESAQDERIIQAQTRLQVARARYNTIVNQYGQNQVIATFSGVISERFVDPGQFVNANMPLFSLENANTALGYEDAYEIHVTVPESWWGKIAVNDRLRVDFPYTTGSWIARVNRVSGKVDPKLGGFAITLVLYPNEQVEEVESGSNNLSFVPEIHDVYPNLTDGMSAYIYLSETETTVWSVPTQSLKRRGNQFFLWTIDSDNRPIQHSVKVVAEDGEYSQILDSFMPENAQVITNPSVNLFNS